MLQSQCAMLGPALTLYETLARHRTILMFLARHAGLPSPAKRHKSDLAAIEELQVKRLHEHATLPVRGSAQAAGYDLARCHTLC